MFLQLPVLTLVLCMLKSTVAGLLAGILPRVIKNRDLSAIAAAIACPVCNTGILCIGILAFYNDLVTTWAIAEGFSNAIGYVILGMVGVNFLVELAINLVLVPVILRVLSAIKI